MGTRGVIARVQGDGWAGRYHHWDSYPTQLGKRLYEVWNEDFHGDTAAMLNLLVDDHRVGWSTIIGSDILKPAGYINFDRKPSGAGEEFYLGYGPQCYCHGDRAESDEFLIESTEQPIDREWAYAINEEKPVMTVFKSSGWEGQWVPVAVVRLDGPEPDWEEIEHASE